jgi:type IX secretion system PorP/SprF family membrane protein
MKTHSFLIYIFVSVLIFGQNDIQLSHQAFVRQYFNPAATGQNLNTVFNTIYRVQWTGINGAPETWVGNFQHYFNAAHLALGVNVIDDKLGLEHHQFIKLAYAYRIFWNENNYLSFGLSAGALFKKIDMDRFSLDDNTEQVQIPENAWKPDFDAGLEFRLKKWMVGLSVTHLGNTFPKSTLFLLPMHYYGYIRFNQSWTPDYELSLSYSMNTTTFITLHELNGSLLFKQLLFGGLSYRFNEAIVTMLGIQLFKQLKIGYSFDMSAGRLPTYVSHHSHEIFLQYLFYKDATGQPSPRFFD